MTPMHAAQPALARPGRRQAWISNAHEDNKATAATVPTRIKGAPWPSTSLEAAVVRQIGAILLEQDDAKWRCGGWLQAVTPPGRDFDIGAPTQVLDGPGPHANDRGAHTEVPQLTSEHALGYRLTLRCSGNEWNLPLA